MTFPVKATLNIMLKHFSDLFDTKSRMKKPKH
jgi:hypothetical protein